MEVFKQSVAFTALMMLMLFGVTLAVTPTAEVAELLANTVTQYAGYAIMTFVIAVGAFSIFKS